MSTAKLIQIKLHKKKSHHILYANENSKSLAVVFPGGNNSCDRPILHYLRKILLDQDYDVLCLTYKDLFEIKDILDKKVEKGIFAINEAIKKVKTEKKYEDTIFISRSYGNVMSSKLKDKYSPEIRRCVYISPTSEGLAYSKKYPGFIVSGTKDEFLTTEDIDKLSNSKDENVLMLKDGPHSLETDSITDTIDFCKAAVVGINEFLK